MYVGTLIFMTWFRSRFLFFLPLFFFPCAANAQNPQMRESSRLTDDGVRLYNVANLDGAIATLKKAVAAWPQNNIAYFNLGLALADKGDFGAAATAYEQGIVLMEAPPPLGTPVVANRKPSIALIESLNNLALVYYQQNRLDEALTKANACVAKMPEHAECSLTQGVVLQAQGKLEEAIASYRKAYALAPKL